MVVIFSNFIQYVSGLRERSYRFISSSRCISGLCKASQRRTPTLVIISPRRVPRYPALQRELLYCIGMDVRWKHPWTSLICGPTGCGKTVFVRRFLKHLEAVSDVAFDRILFYYGDTLDPDTLQLHKSQSPGSPKIEFRDGLPNPEDYSTDNHKKKLIIIDDLMRESSGHTIVDLFTKGSHHKNISVIFITQNIFHQGSGQRDISLNTNYIVIFKNPRDRAQIQHLARQVFPENPKFLSEAYHNATTPPHGYLLLDLKQTTPDNLRLRTGIFPDDARMEVYVPKKNHRK